MVFGKTPLANRALTAQFTARSVHKVYQLRTDRAVPAGEQVLTVGHCPRRRSLCEQSGRRAGRDALSQAV